MIHSSRPRLVALLSLLLLAGCSDPAPSTGGSFQPQSLPTIQLTLATRPFTLQVADDPAEREKGLMFVTRMPADHGMIFVFPDEQRRSFWMKNTPIDLDIVYLSTEGRIVSIHTMTANTLDGTPSEGPARYAIELNRGVARQVGLSVGQVLDLPPELAAAAR